VTLALLASLSRVGRTTTQLPVVTSVRLAGRTEEIFVELPKSTVAFVSFCLTWTVLPDTEEMSPATWSLDLAGGGVRVDVAADDVFEAVGVPLV
jgi:hypothetical protein